MGKYSSDVKPSVPAPPVNPETFPEQLPSKPDADMASKHSKTSIDKGSEMEPFNPDAEPEYPSTRRVIPIAGALYLSFFLVALVSRFPQSLQSSMLTKRQDRTIIATAIPTITDDFHSLGDVGWYGSAYMLAACSLQLLMGRVYTFYNPKTVYLSAIVVFEIGSAICGAAPNSTVFIIGRAIAGAGSAGIFSGAIVIIMNLVPLHKRPVLQGMVGAIFGIASVSGPLLGGVFTTNVSWRWCFYINLPIGGASMVVLFLILQIPGARNVNTPWRQQINQLDPIGTVFFISGIVCLLLALQWGGSTYPWKDGRIIALLVLFAVLISVFIAIQHWKKETATVPPRIIKKRSITAGMWSQFCVGSSMMTLVYYVPIWFQAIKGVSAIRSGIDTLPLILSLVVASITAGILVQKLGYYVPFMIANSIIMSIGAGLITTFTPSTNHPKWIGYQIVFGLGLGLGMQQANLAAQAVLSRRDASTGVALIMFCQQLGGAVFVSIGQNVFSNELIKGLRPISGINPAIVVKTGATEIKNVVDVRFVDQVRAAYNGALTKTFTAALVMAALSIIGALFMEWKNIKKGKQDLPGGDPAGPSRAGSGEVEKGQAKGFNSTDDEKHQEKYLEATQGKTNGHVNV